MNNILEIRNLRKEYDEFVLDDISLDIPKGCVMGLIGPNGAGKTTTIKLIMNLINSDGGEVKAFGLDNKTNEIEIKNRIGYVGEEQHFYDYRSAVWTGKFVSHFFSRWDADCYHSLLKRFDIPPKCIQTLHKLPPAFLPSEIALLCIKTIWYRAGHSIAWGGPGPGRIATTPPQGGTRRCLPTGTTHLQWK